METYHLSDSEYRFMQVVWDAEPVGSGELVALCREKLGWKKSTTYTVLKKLGERGLVQNEESVVTALASRETVTAEAAGGVCGQDVQRIPARLPCGLYGRAETDRTGGGGPEAPH